MQIIIYTKYINAHCAIIFLSQKNLVLPRTIIKTIKQYEVENSKIYNIIFHDTL